MKQKTKKSEFKLSKIQKFVLISIIALIVIFAGALAAISIAAYKPTVAFYNVSEKVQTAIKAELNTMPINKSKKQRAKTTIYNFIVLDNTIPLSAQKKEMKKAKMIFATLDCDVKEFAMKDKKVRPQNASLLDVMPTTTKRTALASGEKLFAVPLLYDFYEIDINRPIYNDSGIKNLAVWNDLLSFFEATISLSSNSPFGFSGKDDKTLIDFVGCITEALDGTNSLDKARDELYAASKKGNLEETVLNLCEEGQPLYIAIENLSELYNAKYLNQTFSDFLPQDTRFFIENHLFYSTFFTLSEHRQIDNNVINEFTSIFVPGKSESDSRTFSAPTIVGIATSKKDYVTEALSLLASSRQSNLTFATSLAPTHANCSIPDKQADDVRFWLAASSGPNMPLSAALPSDEMKNIVAEFLRKKSKMKN